jgi:hypothetical protein
LLAGVAPLQAHKQSDAYLTLELGPGPVVGEWHLALRDLEEAVGLDADGDGAITWGELRAAREAVSAYATSRLRLRSGGAEGAPRVTGLAVDDHSDGAYAVVRFSVEGLPRTDLLEVNYSALFDLDAGHRGLLRLQTPGGTRTAVFAPGSCNQRFEVGMAATATGLLAFVREGVVHIWTGYDHLLFLLALLLPSVLRRKAEGWEPVAAVRPAMLGMFKIVTAFTAAHSITLGLAASGWVSLPSRWVESAIAASVVLAALNNLVPMVADRGWVAAFLFGLIHGFGFANALQDLGLQRGDLVGTLLAFNLGVETGQMVIVALFMPVALGFRSLLLYERWILRGGSVAIVGVAAAWLAERILDTKWLPF